MPRQTKHVGDNRSATQRLVEFLADLRIFTISLKSSNTELDRTAYESLMVKKSKDAIVNTRSNYQLAAVHEDTFDATADFKLTLDRRGAKGSVLSIECAYHIQIGSTPPIHKDLAETFTHSMLELLVWPYFREFVSDITGRMSIEPITIPFEAGYPEREIR